MGDYFQEADTLAKVDTFFATLLTARPLFSMFGLDAFAVRAVVVVVINVSVGRRIFLRIRIVRIYLCHSCSPSVCFAVRDSMTYQVACCQPTVDFAVKLASCERLGAGNWYFSFKLFLFWINRNEEESGKIRGRKRIR